MHAYKKQTLNFLLMFFLTKQTIKTKKSKQSFNKIKNQIIKKLPKQSHKQISFVLV